jgi:hypothetical protein
MSYWRGLRTTLVLTAAMSAVSVQAQAPAAPPDTAGNRSAEFGSLLGRWVRPDGGYRVTIESVSADGKLEASYANPSPLPFARAEATRNGNEIEVFLELTAGGYGGSTYTLTYDPAMDILRGVYYQAVAKQRFIVYFERQK